MNWSRAKTILIALLLAVDIFLLVVYIARDNGVRRDEMGVRADVCSILSAQGIEVAVELVPLDSVEIRPAMLRRKGNMEKAASAFLGKVTEESSGESVTYFGNGGSIMFSDDAFSLVYESGENVENEDDARALARSVAGSLAVSGSSRDWHCEANEGGYTVKIPQVFSGVPVFDSGIELKISAA
ncbi:MAG: hypothetical protein IJ299_03960, partial [Oscillospiraceae bacterium]|nr:hypothetical protein [Oscillospiraceae bacterium]